MQKTTARKSLRLDIRNALAWPSGAKSDTTGISLEQGVSQDQMESVAPALETAIEEIKNYNIRGSLSWD